MRPIQWIILVVGVIFLSGSAIAGVQVLRGKWHDPYGESRLEFGQFSMQASQLIPLFVLIGAIGVAQFFVWGGPSASGSSRPLQPVAASLPTQDASSALPALVTPSMLPRTSQPSPSPTSTSTPNDGPPWRQVTDSLDMVVERATWSASNPGHLDLAVRVENDSDNTVDFSLSNFLAIDNSGIHYTADQNQSNWQTGCCDSAYLSSGQRIAGDIVLAGQLPQSTTALTVSFNVDVEMGSYADINVTIPVPARK